MDWLSTHLVKVRVVLREEVLVVVLQQSLQVYATCQ